LNLKYYNFDLNFDTTEFTAENKHRCGSDTLDDARAPYCPMIPPSKAINAYEVY
jgi:hypothetical protein